MPHQTAEATVEVLTAEVRVLMVGSRQVTLSVARQLDEVESGKITPFGRIRTGRSGEFAVTGMVEVIGRTAGGALARSVTGRKRYLCDGTRSHYGPRVNWNGQDVIVSKCPEHPGYAYTDAEKWELLPLIVLAGLR